MFEKTGIKLPLIYDHPLPGRILKSSIVIRGVLYFIICIAFIPNIVLYIEGDTQLRTYLPTSIALIGTIVVSYFLAMYVIKEFFCDSIIKLDSTIKHIPSKYSRKETITYDLRAMDSILFKNLRSTNQYVIYLVEKSGNSHAIIDKFAMDLGGKEITDFIFKLRGGSGTYIRL